MCLYVREISLAEGRRLQTIVRRDKDRIRVRRAQIVLASAQGSKVPDIARSLYFSPGHVCTIIKEFTMPRDSRRWFPSMGADAHWLCCGTACSVIPVSSFTRLCVRAGSRSPASV